MKLFVFLLKISKKILFFSIFMGVLAGLANVGILSLIHQAIEPMTQPRYEYLLGMFALLWLAYGGFCLLADYSLQKISQLALYQIRTRLCHQILHKQLAELEQTAQHRLMSVLTEDIAILIYILDRLPRAIISFATIMGCYIYIAWLSWPVALLNIAFVLLVLLVYQLPLSYANRRLTAVRNLYDELALHFKGIVQGSKDLLQHQLKKYDFLQNDLHHTCATLMEKATKAKFLTAALQRWGELLILLALALLAFVLPLFLKPSVAVLTGIILASLFSISPSVELSNLLPDFANANVSLKKLESYGFDIYQASQQKPVTLLPTQAANNNLSLQNISHHYYRESNDDLFELGPINLSFQAGEITFIVGGNGSGKTTLAKIISGLYVPLTGSIVWNGEMIKPADQEAYRQNFSVIYADSYLFERLLGRFSPNDYHKIERYLAKLQLDYKIKIKDGKFSTINVSQGQRKRLALLAAYLEDRPCYLFDEWAADQDPVFRRVFYEELLPELKQQNKMVIVISHDDAYFGLADKIVKLDYGQVRQFDNIKPAD
ncbi:MAG: cyclic peptide transporter [Gammaproteobacteria bacterium]|jgi:putative ATP-binding cassette transporter|nr:cyclic peptide transporter [Gammaproteobacteria bacterium]